MGGRIVLQPGGALRLLYRRSGALCAFRTGSEAPARRMRNVYHHTTPPPDELTLRAESDARRERAQRSGLSSLPTMALLLVLPFVLIARLAAFTWRRALKPLYLRLRRGRTRPKPQHEEFLERMRAGR